MLFRGGQVISARSAWPFLCRDAQGFSAEPGCFRQTSLSVLQMYDAERVLADRVEAR